MVQGQKNYVLTQDYNAPYVVNTGIAHKPTAVKVKQFKKGEIVKGQMKYANGAPNFVLVQDTLVMPLEVIREVITKEIVSGVDAKKAEKKETEDLKKVIVPTNPKIQFVDAAILGAVVGFAGVWFAEKRGWITSTDHKNKLYGALGVALVGVYLVYRFKNKDKKAIKTSKP